MGWGIAHTSRQSILDVTAQAGNVTVENKLVLANTDYGFEIARGHITGARSFAKMGYNGDIDTAEEDVWSQGGKYVFPTGATAMEVVSSAAGDAAAGTGIQQVRVTYLDAAFIEQTEVVTLNGVGAVAMLGTPLRVNAVRAYRVGANKVAAGNILVRGAGGGATYRAISTGQTRGRSLIYTVPFGKDLYLTDSNISSSSQTAQRYVLFTLRSNYDDQVGSKVGWMEPYFEIINPNAQVHLDFPVPIKVPATCDLVMSGIGSDNNNICSVSVRGWQENV